LSTSQRTEADLEFADGTTRKIKPLTIKNLRIFLKAAEKIDDSSTKLSDEDIDNMMDAAQIIMETVDSELASNRAKLEEAIDIEIFGKLMAVAMGNSISDPNE
jgi:hypothetical protein